MTLTKNKLAVAIAIALTASLGLVGCGDDKSVSTAVGIPNPNTLTPTGTLQGVLRDAVTNEPIVGAVIDIGIASTVTTETGQFFIKDVPATGSIGAADAGSNGEYQVVIDLRNVKQATGTAKYPDFSFATASVTYSSLNDGSNDAGTSSSNHDTPVNGLTAPKLLKVGKLAAGIKGIAIKDATLAPVGADYTVKLVSLGDAPNANSAVASKGGTGASENVVAIVKTDSKGAFSFSNVESLRSFRIDIENADGTERGSESVMSPADGQVKTLLAQRGDDALDLRTVLVASTDTLAPKVLNATPENGSEVAPNANVAVKFAFSEPIVSNALTNSLTSASKGNGGLYDMVNVEFKGAKAGNIPYSLAWNAERTELTVTIPTVLASSKYTVDITGAASLLVDNQNNVIDFASAKTAASNGKVNFTTNGAAVPAIVDTLTVQNRASLDVGGTPIVDWLPVAGAKGYNVYRAKSVAGGAFGAYESLTKNEPVVESDYSDNNAPFVENGLKVSYKYMVRPVSKDYVESGDSTSVAGTDVAQDNTAPNAPVISNMSVDSKQVTVTFVEQMDEGSAETLANYVLAATVDDSTTPGNEAPQTAPTIPVLQSAIYSDKKVTLTYASNVPAGTTLTVAGVKDVAGNVMKTTDDQGKANNTESVNKVTVAAISKFGGTQVRVTFSAEMGKASAETGANYIWKITPATPELNPAPTLPTCTPVLTTATMVTLTCTAAIPAGVTLDVFNVKDKYGTVADSGSQKF